MTNRTLTNLPAGKTIKARVCGLFIYSGYSIEGKNLGGGGGAQDLQYRFDHVRHGRPAVYPVSTMFFKAQLRLHGTDEGYLIKSKSTNKWKENLSELEDIDPRHEYEIFFKVPDDGTVHFEVNDGGSLQSTWDNSGAFVLTLLGVSE